LSIKYLVDPLHKAVIDAMRRFDPDSLVRWCLASPVDGLLEFTDDVKDTAMVMKSAYEAKAEVLLRTAYYDLCGLRMEHVVQLDHPECMVVIYSRGKQGIMSMIPDFIQGSIKTQLTACPGCKEPRCKRAWTTLQSTADQTIFQGSNWLRMPNPLDALGLMFQFECMADACGRLPAGV
jgi:hypothetical protein